MLRRDPVLSRVLTVGPAQGSGIQHCSGTITCGWFAGVHPLLVHQSVCSDVGCGEPLGLLARADPSQETHRSSRSVNPFCSAHIRQIRDSSEQRERILGEEDKGLWKTITLGTPLLEACFISKVLSSSTTHLFQDTCALKLAVFLSLPVVSVLRMANPLHGMLFCQIDVTSYL